MPVILRADTARVSAILPAAGAYDTTPIVVPCDIFQTIVFHISYTAGAAGGGVSYKVEFSNGGTNWYQTSYVESQTLVSGVDQVNKSQRVEQKYIAVGLTAENFTSFGYFISGRWARISFKESGQVGTPGTVFATYFLNGAN